MQLLQALRNFGPGPRLARQRRSLLGLAGTERAGGRLSRGALAARSLLEHGTKRSRQDHGQGQDTRRGRSVSDAALGTCSSFSRWLPARPRGCPGTVHAWLPSRRDVLLARRLLPTLSSCWGFLPAATIPVRQPHTRLYPLNGHWFTFLIFTQPIFTLEEIPRLSLLSVGLALFIPVPFGSRQGKFSVSWQHVKSQDKAYRTVTCSVQTPNCSVRSRAFSPEHTLCSLFVEDFQATQTQRPSRM